jgi:hypothetical protein
VRERREQGVDEVWSYAAFCLRTTFSAGSSRI